VNDPVVNETLAPDAVVPNSGVNDGVDLGRTEPGRSGHERVYGGAGRSSLQEPSPAWQEPPAAGRRPLGQRPQRPANLRRRGHWIFPQALDTVRSLLMILVAALFTLTFILQPFSIPSESMERTLLVGDFLMVNKSMLAPPGWWSWLMPYRAPRRGDIIVFHFPLDPPDHLVKRVVASPGDRLRVHNGHAVVNGITPPEPYAAFELSYADPYRDQFPAVPASDPAVDTRWALEMRHEIDGGQLLVPENSYFVMGDNRNHSRDSRYWGYVPEENIVGTPFLIYFSVRKPSATDDTGLPDDRLGNSAMDKLVDFARWNRILQVVR
jgi:signal peptidase I